MRRVLSVVLPPVLVAAAIIGAVELALRFARWEHRVPFAGDPFVNVMPFFHRGRNAQRVEVMWRVDGPEFAVEKARNTFRVFVLGESSVQGVPYPREFSFSAFLQTRLAAALPHHQVEVINCGVSGIASWHVLRIAHEVVNYQPDLVLVYTGHNDYYVREVAEPGFWLQQAAQLRTMQLAVVAGQALRQWRKGALDEDLARDPFQPLLMRERADGRDTMTAEERRRITDRLVANLHEMMSLARGVGAVGAVASLAQNLRDWSPGSWRHRRDLGRAARRRWARLFAAGESRRRAGACDRALGAYAAAARIDDQPAALHFARGRCLEKLRRWPAARAAYRMASDLDAVPMGAPSSLNAAIRRMARRTGALFVDVGRGMRSASTHGLVGDDLFADFAHPNLRGNQIIAALIADALRDAGVPVPAQQWVAGYRDPAPRTVVEANPKLVGVERTVRNLCLFMLYGRDRVPRWDPGSW